MTNSIINLIFFMDSTCRTHLFPLFKKLSQRGHINEKNNEHEDMKPKRASDCLKLTGEPDDKYCNYA